MTEWDSFLTYAADEAFEQLDRQYGPVMDDQPGHPSPPGDVYVARLYGVDGQVDVPMWRIPRVETVLRRPIRQPLSTPFEPPLGVTMPVAEYRPQAAFFTMSVDAGVVIPPPDVEVGPPDFMVRLVFVRYRQAL